MGCLIKDMVNFSRRQSLVKDHQECNQLKWQSNQIHENYYDSPVDKNNHHPTSQDNNVHNKFNDHVMSTKKPFFLEWSHNKRIFSPTHPEHPLRCEITRKTLMPPLIKCNDAFPLSPSPADFQLATALHSKFFNKIIFWLLSLSLKVTKDNS